MSAVVRARQIGVMRGAIKLALINLDTASVAPAASVRGLAADAALLLRSGLDAATEMSDCPLPPPGRPLPPPGRPEPPPDDGDERPVPIEAPPYRPGDLVVERNPGCTLTVLDVRRVGRGWIVRAGRSGRDYVAAPAESFHLAPSSYRDPPAEPCGSAAAGLSAADWRAKGEHDAADRAYQAALVRYHRGMMRWAEDHAARVNPNAAREASRAHGFLLGRALDRLAGRDPDALPALAGTNFG